MTTVLYEMFIRFSKARWNGKKTVSPSINGSIQLLRERTPYGLHVSSHEQVSSGDCGQLGYGSHQPDLRSPLDFYFESFRLLWPKRQRRTGLALYSVLQALEVAIGKRRASIGNCENPSGGKGPALLAEVSQDWYTEHVLPLLARLRPVPRQSEQRLGRIPGLGILGRKRCCLV